MDTQTDNTTEELPPELQAIMDEMKANKLAKIESIGKEVAKKRDEAVKARKQSGIEVIWEEDEEYYQGVDEANRDSHPWVKSASATSGGLSRDKKDRNQTRCSSFFNITRQFVESAAARMGDILLPAGDWNFSVKPTPVQDDQGQAPVQPGQPDPQADAIKRAEKAELWIQDKLVECSYHSEMRLVIDDTCRLGTGVIKGPFPDKQTSRKVTTANGKTVLEMVSETNPASRRVDLWDFFPDPACGDNIHNGSFTIERDRLSAKQLRDLKGQPGYLSDQIDKVLDEGPAKKNYCDNHRTEDQTTDSDRFEVWYFYGLIDVVGLSAMNVSIEGEDSKKEFMPGVVTLVNETPIKAFLNPMDSGEFPYDLMPWQRVAGSPWGQGIARQGRTAQDMLNASARNLMDNAGLAGGPMVILKDGKIRPANGRWEITARKVWIANDESVSVADAFTAINIPMVQNELNGIIQLAYKMMEDATGIMYLLQGQQGSAPDTVGGMELLHRNASAMLRLKARIFDERITEPHIRRYYDWLLMHGPDDCKGDLKIEAIGSTALVEREIQSMQAMQLLQLSANPIYKLDPAKAMEQVLLAQRFIVDKWVMDAATLAKIQPAVVPAIEVAKIKSADLDKTLAQEKDMAIAAQTLEKHKIDVSESRENVYADTKAQEVQTNAQMRKQELDAKIQLATLDYANKRNISLDQVKAELAKEAMRLRTQKELAVVAQEVETGHVPPADKPQTIEAPPVQVPGRAPDGHAFEQV